MANITSTTASTAIVKLIAAEALPMLIGNLVMGNIVNRNYEATLAKEGDTVNVPIPPVLSANTKAINTAVTRQVVAPGNAQIVLNTHVEASFAIEDVAKALSTPDLLNLYMRPAILAIAERIEGDLMGLYSSLTVNTALGLAGTAITEAVIDSAETTLFNQKVPVADRKFLVVNGTTYGQIRQITRFSEYRTAQEAGLQALLNGNVGKLKDFWVLRSQYVKSTGSSPVTVHNLAFGENALALVIRQLGGAMPGTGVVQERAEMGNFGLRVTLGYDKDQLATTCTVDCLYGVGVLRAAHGVEVNT
ncbi:MAG: hypothetical protein EPO02_13085 [Nitrospirae bacterium]|nr:MAG: hypothetical protein EPO02_13085 [Nitrospirota bacterium]